MFESFTITFSQVFVLFVYIAIGFSFKKTGKIPDKFNKGISNLLVYIFLPFLIFGSMADNFKIDVLKDKIDLLIISTGMLCAFLVIAFIFSRILSKKRETRDVYMYSFTFPNSGYIGNPLVLGIFGELMLFDFMIMCIPYLILTYTYGIYILNPERKFNIKNIVNPIMISLILGMIAGLLNLKLPTAIQTIVDTGANCMAPSAMILTGVVFASNNLKTMVTNVKVYIACAIKIILIPLVVIFFIVLAKVPQDLAVLMVVILSLPTGLNSIVFPEAYGGDSRTGAQLCFVSTLTCLIFLPVMLLLYQIISGLF